MNENQQPVDQEKPAEAEVSSVGPTPVQNIPHAKRAFLTRPRVIAAGIVVLAMAAGFGFYGHRQAVRNAKIQAPAENIQQTASNTDVEKSKAPADAATLSQQGAKPPAGSASPKTTPKSTAPAATTAPPAPAPTPAPAPNTTNCLPSNPSPYATEYTSMTNSQYLQTNGYVNTTKLYAALQFAGLINTINSKQYVVLAMDDSQWNNFTATQLNWMNASPANMRSVLGWQIITSCITWDGVNPVKDMTIGATRTVTTLNGTVTYTHNTGGLGAFGNGKVGIWDWFTSNGSVTIAGFVNTSSIP